MDKFDILHVADDDDGWEDEVIERGRQERNGETIAHEDMDSESTAPPGQSMPSWSSTVGSALQRNLDGSVVAPQVIKKKRQGKKVDVPSCKCD